MKCTLQGGGPHDIVSSALHGTEICVASQMEVGIEDCLHIEFEYDKGRYHLKDTVVGKIYFLLVSKLRIGIACYCAMCFLSFRLRAPWGTTSDWPPGEASLMSLPWVSPSPAHSPTCLGCWVCSVGEEDFLV